MAAAAGDPVRATDDDTITQSSSAKPLVRLIQQVAQSLVSGANTALTFSAGSEDIDTDGWHDTVTNNSRVTPTVAGYYRVTAAVNFVASTTTVGMQALTAKNGSVQSPSSRARPNASSLVAGAQADALLSANGTTDYFEAFGWQSDSGAAARLTNITAAASSTLEVEFLRPL